MDAKNTKRLLSPALICLMLSWAPVAQAIPPVYTLQTGIGSDDVSGESDTFYHVTGSALFSQGLSRNSIIDYIVELSSYNYQDNDNNSDENIFLQAEYSYTPRAGFSVPTYSAALRQEEEFKDNSEFDASTTSLLFSVSYRIDSQSNVLGGLRFRERASKNDTSETGYFINFDYLAGNRWVLYATLIVAQEETDVDLSAASRVGSKSHLPGEPGFVPPSGSGSVLGSDFLTVDSDNSWVTLGASYGLNGNSSIDMSIEQQTYDTDNGKIDGNVITFDYFYRF